MVFWVLVRRLICTGGSDEVKRLTGLVERGEESEGPGKMHRDLRRREGSFHTYKNIL